MENKYFKYRLFLHDSCNYTIRSLEEYKEMCKHSVFEMAKYLCLKEMYERAQPSADLDKLLEEHFNRIKSGLEGEPFYKRYYISFEEGKYIVDKYIKAFNFKDPWNDYLDLLIEDVRRVRIIDKYIPDYEDEYGVHPGHRGYEELDPITKTDGQAVADKITNFIKERKEFYCHDILENAFSFQIHLGIAPNSNPEAVKEYWKENGINIDIDPREHDAEYFWCEENGCLDDENDELTFDDDES